MFGSDAWVLLRGTDIFKLVDCLLHREDIDRYKGFFTFANISSSVQKEAKLKVALMRFIDELETAIQASRSALAKVEKGLRQSGRVQRSAQEVYYLVQVFKAYAIKTIGLWSHAVKVVASAHERIIEIHNLAEDLLEEIFNFENSQWKKEYHPNSLKDAVERLVQQEFQPADAVRLTYDEVEECIERIKAVHQEAYITIAEPPSLTAEPREFGLAVVGAKRGLNALYRGCCG